MDEKYIRRRILKGLCRYCGERNFMPGTVYCEVCREKFRKRMAKLRKKRRENGKCSECNTLTSKYTRCLEHRKEAADYQRRRWLMRKERGR